MTETPIADTDDPGPANVRPQHCRLAHPIFALCGPILFRRASSDDVPVMVVAMGDIEVSVPLRSLQREFAIDDDSDDGRMLGLIAESLDYVSMLQLGDALPAEVLTGQASWQPMASHRATVAGRLQLQLLKWLEDAPATGVAIAESDLAGLVTMDLDPRRRRQVQIAFERAAGILGLAAPSDVVALFELLCDELAYIEALRQQLLLRVHALSVRLHRLGGSKRDGERTQMLIQVQRLSEIGLRSIQARFADVDGHTAEIMHALRNARGQQALIRSNRDWLYRCKRAWDPVLQAWEAHLSTTLDHGTWPLIASTYQFLAPRYRPSQEWQSLLAPRPKRGVKMTGAVAW